MAFPDATPSPNRGPLADSTADHGYPGRPAREARLGGDLVSALLTHADELSDLNETDGGRPRHSHPDSLADRLHQQLNPQVDGLLVVVVLVLIR